MSSEHEHQVEVARPHSEERFGSFGGGQSSGEEHAGSNEEIPEPETGPIPLWLVWLIGLGLFWAGAYLFSFSGGFKANVFDYEPKFGAQGWRPKIASGSESGWKSALFGELHYLPSSQRRGVAWAISAP